MAERSIYMHTFTEVRTNMCVQVAGEINRLLSPKNHLKNTHRLWRDKQLLCHETWTSSYLCSTAVT